MTRPKTDRVCLYFREDGLTLTTNNVATIESCLNYLKYSSSMARESVWSVNRKRITIAIEELQATLFVIWPGQTGDEKRLKFAVMDSLFRSRSWTAIEGMAADDLDAAVAVMRHFEQEARNPENKINSESAVIALIQSCKDLEQGAADAMPVEMAKS